MIFNDIGHINRYFAAYALQEGFSIKKGHTTSLKTYHVYCKCHGKPKNSRNLPSVVGVEINGKKRVREPRTRLCDCQWQVRFKQQFNEQYVLVKFIDEHTHPMEKEDAILYAENRQTNEQGMQLMRILKQTSATYQEIANVVNSTTGSKLLARDVYNRTRDVPRGPAKSKKLKPFVKKKNDV
ncbi:hypothetical protein V1514DRAFT_279552 [Lipomyces japonicus]|uniref:uncharacterized protein n=1 Tax=Lipomyces japonicus TaxID=56871 RepID=UPI0034CE53B8